jgi:hypothetical protein
MSPKITKLGGVSNVDAGRGQPGWTMADELHFLGKLGPYEETAESEPEPSEPPAEPEPDEPEPEPEESSEIVRPSDSASKGEWVAYVVAITGRTEEDVSGDTRAKLIEAYGA